jgi:hypothetical protein
LLHGKTEPLFSDVQMCVAKSRYAQLAEESEHRKALTPGEHGDLVYSAMSALVRGRKKTLSTAPQEIVDLFADAVGSSDGARSAAAVSVLVWPDREQRVLFLARVLKTSSSSRAHRRIVRMLERDDERIELATDGLVPPERIAALMSRREPSR